MPGKLEEGGREGEKGEIAAVPVQKVKLPFFFVKLQKKYDVFFI